MDHRNKFAVEPGAKVRLSKIDAFYTGKHETHEKALPEIQKHVERIDKLQYPPHSRGRASSTTSSSPRCSKATRRSVKSSTR
jgi:hypothetical protein